MEHVRGCLQMFGMFGMFGMLMNNFECEIMPEMRKSR